jgi:hypothetical protein
VSTSATNKTRLDPRLAKLQSGDGIQVRSFSGNLYSMTFLGVGDRQAGLYVRIPGRGLARLSPHRLDLDTLEQLAPGRALLVGDEVLFEPEGGEELRGTLLSAPTRRLTIQGSGGQTLSVPLDSVVEGSLRLLFRSSDLLPGDEFVVSSNSGQEYRGAVAAVTGGALRVRSPEREEYTLLSERLNLYSIKVLIPIEVASQRRAIGADAEEGAP